MNNQEFAVNPDLIKFIERATDTVVSLTTGEKIVVRETADELIERIIRFRRRILTGLSSVVIEADERGLAANELTSPSRGTRG